MNILKILRNIFRLSNLRGAITIAMIFYWCLGMFYLFVGFSTIPTTSSYTRDEQMNLPLLTDEMDTFNMFGSVAGSLIIIAASFVVFSPFIATKGLVSQNLYFLYTFITFIFISSLISTIAAIYTSIEIRILDTNRLRSLMLDNIKYRYNRSSNYYFALWHSIQIEHKCCGMQSYLDWQDAPAFDEYKARRNQTMDYCVPVGCCSSGYEHDFNDPKFFNESRCQDIACGREYESLQAPSLMRKSFINLQGCFGTIHREFMTSGMYQGFTYSVKMSFIMAIIGFVIAFSSTFLVILYRRILSLQLIEEDLIDVPKVEIHEKSSIINSAASPNHGTGTFAGFSGTLTRRQFGSVSAANLRALSGEGGTVNPVSCDPTGDDSMEITVI